MTAELVIRIDGRQPLSAEAVAAVTRVCDEAEEREACVRVAVWVSGAPADRWADGLTVGLVSKWERVLRRLERLPAVTIGLAEGGDCGGAALDALLATDYRIALASVRLVVPVREGTTWPGMTLYRLARHGVDNAAIRRAVLFGTPLAASDALAPQLIHEITDDLPGALTAAGAITEPFAGSDLALRRQLLFDAAVTGFEEALGAHLAACDRALRRPEPEAIR